MRFLLSRVPSMCLWGLFVSFHYVSLLCRFVWLIFFSMTMLRPVVPSFALLLPRLLSFSFLRVLTGDLQRPALTQLILAQTNESPLSLVRSAPAFSFRPAKEPRVLRYPCWTIVSAVCCHRLLLLRFCPAFVLLSSFPLCRRRHCIPGTSLIRLPVRPLHRGILGLLPFSLSFCSFSFAIGVAATSSSSLLFSTILPPVHRLPSSVLFLLGLLGARWGYCLRRRWSTSKGGGGDQNQGASA